MKLNTNLQTSTLELRVSKLRWKWAGHNSLSSYYDYSLN